MTRPLSDARRRLRPPLAPCGSTGTRVMPPAKKTSEMFVGKMLFTRFFSSRPCLSLSRHSCYASLVWPAYRTAKAVTPAVVTAVRTPSTRRPRKRASSLPSGASLARKRRADPASLARTPPAKVSYGGWFHDSFCRLLCFWLSKVLLFVAGTPEAESSPKDGLGMGTLGGPAEKNRKLQKK